MSSVPRVRRYGSSKKNIPKVRKRNRESDLKVVSEKDIFLKKYRILGGVEEPYYFDSFYGDTTFEHMNKDLLANVVMAFQGEKNVMNAARDAYVVTLGSGTTSNLPLETGFLLTYQSYYTYVKNCAETSN